MVDLMSSEESGEEEEGTRCFIHRPLSWRSIEVNNLMASLDRKIQRRRRDRAIDMVTKRITGIPSERKRPDSIDIPEWAVCSTGTSEE